ncbi:MAG: penicillin-binding protein 2 [Chloroflexota bacterium]
MAAPSYNKRYKSTDQQESLRRRLPLLIALMVIATLYLVVRLMTFQYQPSFVMSYYNRLANYNYNESQRIAAARGIIYDREGQPLASNTFDYEIGISPSLIAEPQRVATQLSAELSEYGIREIDVLNAVRSGDPWVLLAKPVAPRAAEQVRNLELLGVTISAQPRRLYPQGTLAAQLLGFVAGDDSDQLLRGYNGIEGYYRDELAGRVRDETTSRIPFDLPENRETSDIGSDLVLTIDRDIQFLVESELQLAVTENGATGGTIIVMNPRTGEILAMASNPSYDPNTFFTIEDPDLLRNPAVSDEYEPGSVMKVITMAIALDLGAVTPEDTYVDNGVIEVGGIAIPNADRQARGVVGMEQIIVQSLNVGASTLALKVGPGSFYEKMNDFGIGRATGVDLEGEAAGTLFIPGDPNWSESNLATNSFGQGVATTPLQMITAVSAIANDGLIMQPHVVHQIVDGNRVYPSQPSTLERAISPESAQIVTDMMVQTVEQNLTDARVPGYAIAGKSGTAEIPTPLGYEAGASIASFVGFFPADDPQVIILVKIDRPVDYWGSIVAAPIFSRLAERLAILLEIPSDDIRQGLKAEGGSVNDVWSR